MPLTSPAIDLSDRARGCILAGAIGDAMGGPFEGRPGPLAFREPPVWLISDDSQLTLATCESITEVGGVLPDQIAARFVAWFRDGRIMGIGASTLKALRDLDAGAHWALAGAKGEMSAGNGAAMRIAPLAFYLDPAVAQHRQLLRDVCRITHHNEEAYAGALAVQVAIRSLAYQLTSPDCLLASVVELLPDSRVRDRIAELTRVADDLNIAHVAREYGSSGYVVESVPLALCAAQLVAHSQLDDILRQIIEGGGDTDTVASMAGQMMGTWLGASQIPRNMIESLTNAAEIEQIANEFAITVTTVA
jgi:ADP-ribosylglycohydrolase